MDKNMDSANNLSKFNVTLAAAWLLVVVLVTFILRSLDFLFIPLCFAILVCYALAIPMDFLKRFHLPGFWRIILVVGLVLLLIFLLGNLVALNVESFQTKLPEYETKFWDYANLILSRFNVTKEQANETIHAFLGKIKQSDFSIGNLVRNFSGSFFAFLGNSHGLARGFRCLRGVLRNVHNGLAHFL